MNKARGGDGIPNELFEILKDDAVKSATLNMTANLENSAVATGLERSDFIPIPKDGNAEECSYYCTIAFISHASKVKLKIFQARLQQYVNHELLDVQAGFRKSRRTRDQIDNMPWIINKALTMPKPLTVWITINYGKFFNSGNTRPPDLPPENSVCRSRSNG